MRKKSGQFIDSFLIFIKGLFMGSADIIPGVSGGTIAFITGIYEKFIFALKSINLRFVYYYFRGIFHREYLAKGKKEFFSIEFKFLIPLGLGITVAFISLANVLGIALEHIPTYTYGFFFGLILASSLFIYFNYKKVLRPWYFILFVFIGGLFSYSIVGFEIIQTNDPSLLMMFVAGVISFCAMILPGLSGAFILYILGQYEFLLNDVLREITHFTFDNVHYGLSYGIGGLVGLLGFSRVITFLFKKYHMPTLAFILGLMIGALRKPGEFIINHPQNHLLTAFSIICGTCIVIIFSYYEFLIKKRPNMKSS